MEKERLNYMIHILFGDSEAATLKHVLKKILANKERVFTFGEIFSVGPIWRLQDDSGFSERMDWMKNIIKDEFDEYKEFRQEYPKVINRIKSISLDEQITIWTSENASEQTGLRFVLFLLKGRSNVIKVINTTKAFEELFNQPKIQYTVRSSGEIAPEKLAAIYEETKRLFPLDQIERNNLEEEWKHLSETSNTLRIWLNGKLQSVLEDYYDQYIIDTAKKLHNQQEIFGYMKPARLIGDVLGNLEQYLRDEFLEYRLKKLIEKGVFEVEGSMKSMRFYSVMLKN